MMIEESGRVIAIDDACAWVVTQRKTACQSCSAKNSCGTGIIARTFGERTLRFKVENVVNAGVGDSVILGIDDRILVRSSLLLYAMPLLAMLVSGYLGQSLATALSISGEWMTILFAVAGLALSFVILRYFIQTLTVNSDYRPRLLRRCHIDEVVCQGPQPISEI